MNTDRFKFRVWDERDRRYIDGIAINQYGGICALMVRRKEELVIEQCTGIRDKNGNLIYEGDVVDLEQKCIPYYLKVKYLEADLRWHLYSLGSNAVYSLCNGNLVIVGNIHEEKWGIEG